MKKIRTWLACAGVCAVSAAAQALTPPFDPAELRAAADVVVDAEIGTPVRCAGRAEKNTCGERASYTIPFRVRRVLDGTMPETSGTLRFWYQWYDKRGCVGDQGPDIRSGARGEYYLKRSADGTWQIPHWSGVHVLQAGNGILPRCRGTMR